MYQVRLEKNQYVPMRDGVRLAVDVYRPDSPGKLPALLALSPYGKDIQNLPLPPQPYQKCAPQARTALWDGCIEAGDTNMIVSRGYAHVIGDLRGMGDSEGESVGAFPKQEGEDGYDLVEWVAQQPWCDGNVGMVGISYFAYMQIRVALEQPPHLKAIAPFEVHDFAYMNPDGCIRTFWQGLYDGRDTTSGFAPRNVASELVRTLPKEELDALVEEACKHRDLMYDSRIWKILRYPNKNPRFFDMLIKLLNAGHFKKPAPPQYEKLNIPVYLGGWWGGSFTGDVFKLREHLKGPTKIVMWSRRDFEPRPWRTGMEDVLRWYDHWFKGIDTGIMDEAPLKIFVEGIDRWRYEREWPLARTQWTYYYLRGWEGLSLEPENDNPFPDCYVQEPPFVSSKRGSVQYLTPSLAEDVEVTGPVAVFLYASIDQDDTNWRVKITDVDEQGQATTSPLPLTEAWLRASYKGIDESKSKPYAPFHTGIPEAVTPGQIYEYRFALPEISNVFKAGHRIKLEISSMNSGSDPDAHSSSYMVPISRETLHKIYRDGQHRSRILLPIISSG